ncbi:hypothetical protein MJD09_14550 [bacterium]|nr:hypothetical protein [bacterium]
MRNKISYKLILAVGVAIVGIIVIFSIVIINFQHRAMLSQVQHNTNQLSETIGQTL